MCVCVCVCVRGLIETGCHVHIEEQMNKAGFIRAGSYSPPCVQVGCWLIEFISVYIIHQRQSLIGNHRLMDPNTACTDTNL